MKKTQLFPVVFLLAAGLYNLACAPKIATATQSRFAALNSALTSIDHVLQIWQLHQRFPEFQIEKDVLFPGDPPDQLSRQYGDLQQGEISKLITDRDGNCGLYKVVASGVDTFLRVQCIFLGQYGEEGKIFAGEVLQSIRQGAAFESVADQYAQDGNGENGGDLGWFPASRMVRDFTDAVLAHKTGDVFIAETETFGWYVIYNAHAPKIGPYQEVIRAVKPDCSK